MVIRMNTKDILIESFLELTHKKSADKITVKDITENCLLSRETFYYYFPDKFFLIEALCERDIFVPLREAFNSDLTMETLGQVFTDILHKLDEHPQLYTYVLEFNDPNLHFNTYSDQLINIMGVKIKEINNIKKLPEKTYFDLVFFVYASVKMTLSWLNVEDRFTIEKLVESIFNAMPNELKSIFSDNVQLL